MIEPVKSIASSESSTPDPRGGDRSAATSETAGTAKAIQQPLRLVIEPTAGEDGYIYKLFDRATGELLMELPRETATRMSQDPGYTAGQVIDATA